jgi:deaminated glutathione amidase
MKVAAVQMTTSTDVARNLATARRLLRDAAGAGAVLAVLPENFVLMSRQERDKRAIAEVDAALGGGGPIQDMLSASARELGITVIGGTIPLQVAGETRVAAASLVYGPDGSRLGRYDKMHLFDVSVPGAAESHRESAGMTTCVSPSCFAA